MSNMYLVVSAGVLLLCCGVLSCVLLVIFSRRRKSPGTTQDPVQGSFLSTAQQTVQQTARHARDDPLKKSPDYDILENSDDHTRFCAKWESLLKKFNNYTREKYPNDARFANAQTKWTGKMYFFRPKSEDLKTALAFYLLGTIYVNADMITSPGKNIDKPPSELPAATFFLLHELAHTNGVMHDDVWKDAFIAFLRVARDELKWGCSDQCTRMLSKNT